MGSYFFGSGSGAPANADTTYEPHGFGSDGAGTLLTAGATNVKSASWVEIGSNAAADWSGFTLYASTPSTATAYYLVDISFDGATVHIPNIFIAPGASTAQGFAQVIRRRVASGQGVYAKIQSSTGTATLHLAVEGIVSDVSKVPPGFANIDAIIAAASSGASLPSTIDVPFDDGTGTTWTTLLDPTTQAYGALLACVFGNGTALATAQTGMVRLAIGAAASEVEIARWQVSFNTATIACARGWSSSIEKAIALGVRLSARITVHTPGSDKGRIGLHGLR